MQSAVDAESAAAHRSGSNEHGAFAQAGNFRQSKNDVFGFQISQAAAVLPAAAGDTDDSGAAVPPVGEPFG
jgi:exopolysaccharide biosynthesis protein